MRRVTCPTANPLVVSTYSLLSALVLRAHPRVPAVKILPESYEVGTSEARPAPLLFRSHSRALSVQVSLGVRSVPEYQRFAPSVYVERLGADHEDMRRLRPPKCMRFER